MNPETRARAKGMVEGIFRIQPSETPFAAVRRFHELQKEARQAREAADRWSQQAGPLHGHIFGWATEADLEMYTAGFAGRVSKGPGLGREIVLFDTIKLPWTEARRKNRSQVSVVR